MPEQSLPLTADAVAEPSRSSAGRAYARALMGLLAVTIGLVLVTPLDGANAVLLFVAGAALLLG